MSTKMWTKEEEGLLYKLKTEGYTLKEIATKLPGRTVSAVKTRLSKLRSKIKVETQFNPDNKSKRWTEAEEKRLVELRNQGRSISQCAKILGRTEGSITARISTHGLYEKYSISKNHP